MFEPHSSEGGRYWGPFGTTSIPGARVTIIGGQVDGWTAVTDREGRFTWQDYPECALDSAECRARRFRVEAAGYVTVEEGASDPHMFWGPLSPDAGYAGGVIWTSRLEWSTMLAHEYCHAHQDWADNPDTYGLDDRRWAQSPEGAAYREAYAVDRLTNDPWFRTDETHWRGWGESAANICSRYFVGSPGRDRQYIRERLPNLYAWAKEWLRHR